jgi:hypothetical protein
VVSERRLPTELWHAAAPVVEHALKLVATTFASEHRYDIKDIVTGKTTNTCVAARLL